MEELLGAPPGEFLRPWTIPSKFLKMSLKRRLTADQLEHNLKVSGVELKKHLGWFSFACLGMGEIIATGIFSFMPSIYASIAGPAVVFCLLISSMTAAFSAMIYSEFAVEYPVAGGGFVYVLNTFGEFPAVLCACNLVIDYIFGTAAVVRNFSVYLSELFDLHSDVFQKQVSGLSDPIDYMALIVILSLTVVAMISIKVFDEGNMGLQIIHVGLVVFTFLAAFTKADTANWTPFFPYGGRNIMYGSSQIFFVFIGYDVIALGAEEAKSSYSVPIGMIGAVILVTFIYEAMACSLIMLYPFEKLANQPANLQISGFAYAFTQRGMTWAKYIVALGACTGIFTSAGIGVFGLSRIFQVFAREGMFPAFVGRVNTVTYTPIVATLLAGIAAGLMAFFTSFNSLANMTSIGTLTMYWFVAISHIWRRYCPEFEDDTDAGDRHLDIPFRPDPLASLGTYGKRIYLFCLIFVMTMSAVGFAIYWSTTTSYTVLWIMGIVWGITTIILQFTLPICYVPSKFSIPWWCMPWCPALSIWSTVMLIGGFGASPSDYYRLFIAMGIATVIYLFFGVHVSHYRFFGDGAGEGSSQKPLKATDE